MVPNNLKVLMPLYDSLLKTCLNLIPFSKAKLNTKYRRAKKSEENVMASAENGNGTIKRVSISRTTNPPSIISVCFMVGMAYELRLLVNNSSN